MSIRQKINERLDQIEEAYKNEDKELIAELLPTVSKFWSVLDDEQRDYIHAMRFYIDE